MISPATFLGILQRNGVRFFAGVPDSLMEPFCAHLGNALPADRHVIAANEGSAVGLVAGHHLATGQIGCAYMQNSGLGNAVNPLVSLLDPDVYAIPALLLIGWRGEIQNGAQISDEPQHVRQGRITLDLLTCMDIPHVVIGPSDDGAALGPLIEEARAQSRPVAAVIRKGTFSPDAGASQKLASDGLPLSREDALKALVAALPDACVVVCTTGKASRELHDIRVAAGQDPERDFLTVGSMGHALAIASGIALWRPDRTVACIDGDGALLMHLGGMTTSASLPNLLHVVINNGAHESVGGQPTNGFDIDMPALACACGYQAAWRTDDLAGISIAVRAALEALRSGFIEIRTRTGARAGLGRPRSTPGEAKRIFMQSLQRTS